ncbi:MAG TPA: TetR/AcrR family transcriptional regulator [Solirubrobacteraceae bacterium]|nr:TetR/AcrR family transcriptional regulator [Solirubrobacteraceae bacterium]
MSPPAQAQTRRRLKPEQRRELILQGARELLAERGYERMSIADVATAAGITPAVIYDHFDSKAQLVIELLERHTAELLREVGMAVQGVPADAAAQLRAGVEAFFAYVEEHRCAWRIMFRDPPSDPEVAAAYRRLDSQATAAIAVFLRSGDNEGALGAYGDPAKTAEMFAEALKAAQNGLAAWWYVHPDVSREEVVERLLDFAWRGLGQMSLTRGGARK